MEIRIRITRTRLIVGCVVAVLLGAVILFRIAVPGPNAVVTNRNSVQARLAIPTEVREFPVEKHLSRGDWFVYRQAARPDGRRHWRLQIVGRTDDLQKWKHVFRSYLGLLGECLEPNSNSQWPRRAQKMYLRADGTSGLALVTFADASGTLHITFAYYEPLTAHSIWGTRYGRFLALVLRRMGLPVDTVTRPT